MTALTTYELWSLVIQFLSVAATFGAVVVALYVATRAPKASLQILPGTSFPDDKLETPIDLFLTITNTGSTRVWVHSVLFSVGPGAPGFICLTEPKAKKRTARQETDSAKYICVLEPLQEYVFSADYRGVIRALELSYVSRDPISKRRLLAYLWRALTGAESSVRPVALVSVAGDKTFPVYLSDILRDEAEGFRKARLRNASKETVRIWNSLLHS